MPITGLKFDTDRLQESPSRSEIHGGKYTNVKERKSFTESDKESTGAIGLQ